MTLNALRRPIKRVDVLYFAVTKPCPEALVELSHAYNRLADKVEAAWERERDLARLVEELAGTLILITKCTQDQELAGVPREIADRALESLAGRGVRRR